MKQFFQKILAFFGIAKQQEPTITRADDAATTDISNDTRVEDVFFFYADFVFYATPWYKQRWVIQGTTLEEAETAVREYLYTVKFPYPYDYTLHPAYGVTNVILKELKAPCKKYLVINETASTITIAYTSCEGDSKIAEILPETKTHLCVSTEGYMTVPDVVGLTVVEEGTC